MRSRRVEREALLKSFSLFFTSLTLLVAVLFYTLYMKERTNLDARLFSEMRLCSFNLKCPRFTIDFVGAKEGELYLLERGAKEVYALFPLPGSRKYVMKIAYGKERYREDLNRIRKELWLRFAVVEMVVALLSLLFSLFALHPLRQALKLTEEFAKDILHDFNTPLSVIRLNTRMLAKECPDSKKAKRIEEAVETLMRLQENLRGYLGGHALQKERVALELLAKERAEPLEKAHPELRFEYRLEPLEVTVSREAVTRILDNLLSNAVKYNRKGGYVRLVTDAASGRLWVEDSGIGIQNPAKVFERFYKEHDRGLGIGLHIVKKLCDETGIGISVESVPGEGSRFVLDFSKIGPDAANTSLTLH
ncbi:HAMP domain-containing sensor histidine kinase [Hydrogenimonas sp. SS33]|uniref:sensor histidine kinase n=1 Tax=Hydrogenimonas leucolamina TaxID=2954236 RepID=UPI00336C2524